MSGGINCKYILPVLEYNETTTKVHYFLEYSVDFVS